MLEKQNIRATQIRPHAGLENKNDFRTACNLGAAAHVFFTRAHCPSGGLSPRRGRAGVVSLPCRLVAGCKRVSTPFFLKRRLHARRRGGCPYRHESGGAKGKRRGLEG